MVDFKNKRKCPTCEWVLSNRGPEINNKKVNLCGMPCSPKFIEEGEKHKFLCYGHKKCLENRVKKIKHIKNQYIKALINRKSVRITIKLKSKKSKKLPSLPPFSPCSPSNTLLIPPV